MTTAIPDSGLPLRTPRTLAVTVYSAHRQQGKRIGVYKVGWRWMVRMVRMTQQDSHSRQHCRADYQAGQRNARQGCHPGTGLMIESTIA
jgi:alpha-L-fucosidase